MDRRTMRAVAKLEKLDRRWLYGAMVVLCIVPFVVPIPMPEGGASKATRGLYEKIESCPPDGVVLINSGWDMGARAECHAVMECVVHDLCRRKLKFVVTCLGTPFSPEFAARVVEPIATAGAGVVIDGLCKDIHAVRPQDVHGTPVGELPLMKRVRKIEDVHLVYSVAYVPPAEWISFARGQHGTDVAFGCMSIMGPFYHTFIDSGQLCGALIGNSGAAEYEALVDRRGMGTELTKAASFGNAAIIIAALLGNIGLWARLRMRGEEE
ncbi:MAG: hypothetical protein ACYSU0_07865 [Planctomycetota bacterium]|jgi:hypothetical protein